MQEKSSEYVASYVRLKVCYMVQKISFMDKRENKNRERKTWRNDLWCMMGCLLSHSRWWSWWVHTRFSYATVNENTLSPSRRHRSSSASPTARCDPSFLLSVCPQQQFLVLSWDTLHTYNYQPGDEHYCSYFCWTFITAERKHAVRLMRSTLAPWFLSL